MTAEETYFLQYNINENSNLQDLKIIYDYCMQHIIDAGVYANKDLITCAKLIRSEFEKRIKTLITPI